MNNDEKKQAHDLRTDYVLFITELSEKDENEEVLQFLVDMANYHEQEQREDFFYKLYNYAKELING